MTMRITWGCGLREGAFALPLQPSQAPQLPWRPAARVSSALPLRSARTRLRQERGSREPMAQVLLTLTTTAVMANCQPMLQAPSQSESR
jgi:hypothetical protein